MAQAQIIENLQKAIQTLQQKLPVTNYVQMVPSNNLPIQGLTCEEVCVFNMLKVVLTFKPM